MPIATGLTALSRLEGRLKECAITNLMQQNVGMEEHMICIDYEAVVNAIGRRFWMLSRMPTGVFLAF